MDLRSRPNKYENTTPNDGSTFTFEDFATFSTSTDKGQNFFEFYTLLLLRRMLTDEPIGYVDLRSPAGIGLGALVYNYDGKVFASDEGRMLAEMGDKTFELGHVERDDYRSLILSDKLLDLVGSSLNAVRP